MKPPGKPKFIEHQGRRLSIRGWARALGIGKSTIRDRLSRGLPLSEVLSCESRRRTGPGWPATALTRSDRNPVYVIWKCMHRRCAGIGKDAYRYAGRGIRVCDRWRSFAAFVDDMGPRPSLGHSIDRIDNDGHYEPSNCRWATRTVQARNTRVTKWLMFRGERISQAELAERCGISQQKLHQRLRRGWSVEEAVASEPQKRSA